MRLPPGACLSYDSGTDPRVLRLIQGVPEELWGARLALQVQLLSTCRLCKPAHAGSCLPVHVGKRSRMSRTLSAAQSQTVTEHCVYQQWLPRDMS